MFIGSDVGSTHEHRHHHHHHHNLGKDHSTAATTTVTKVSRDSHLIKKSSSLTSLPLTPTSKTHTRQPQPPLIIYAHAPRVIHAKVQEFKALVQTLTGYTGNKNSTTKTTTTKNDLPSPPPPPHPPASLIPPPPSKVPMYYDFEEFETKNVIPLTNNNLFSIHDDHKHNTSMMDCLGGDIGYNFSAPIFETPLMNQTNSTYFTPTYGDQFCCTNNNFNTANSNNSSSVGVVGKVNNNNNNNINMNNQMFHIQNYVAVETGSGSGSGCYYSDGLSSSLDLSSSLSSVEEAIDELTDFS